jgi:hypothetical protein
MQSFGKARTIRNLAEREGARTGNNRAGTANFGPGIAIAKVTTPGPYAKDVDAQPKPGSPRPGMMQEGPRRAVIPLFQNFSPVLRQDKEKPGAVIRPGYPRTPGVWPYLLYSRYKHKKPPVVF